MTIIERKQLAAMQRRVGPNTVGQLNLKTSFNKRYHICSFYTLASQEAQANDRHIKNLFLNRKVPIKPFNEKILSVCNDLTSPKIINKFFKNLELKNKNNKINNQFNFYS